MDKSLLHRVLQIQSVTYDSFDMHEFLIRQCRAYGAQVELDQGNIYVTKGSADIYPCIIAHTDTVHDIVPHNEYMVLQDQGCYYGWNPVKHAYTGVGGDDKVGIFIALSMLTAFDACKVVFFRDEEIGCVGSRLANLAFFKDCSMVLQCDRRGGGDFVDDVYGTELSGVEFHDAIAPYLAAHGYKRTSGAMTDVQMLKDDGMDIVAANMSCGYYNPHSKTEFVRINDVFYCHNLVFDLFDNLGQTQWTHTSPTSSWQSDYYSFGGAYYSRLKSAGNYKSMTFDPVTKKYVINEPSATKAIALPTQTDYTDHTEWNNMVLAEYRKEMGNAPTLKDATASQKAIQTVAKMIATNFLDDAASEDAFDILDGNPLTDDDAWGGALAAAHEETDRAPDCPECLHNGHVMYDDDAEAWACVSCEIYIHTEISFGDDLELEQVFEYHIPGDGRAYIRTSA